MKKISLILLAAMAVFTSCRSLGIDLDLRDDNAALKERVDDLEERLETLEAICDEFNANISALRSIVEAMQDQDYITSISPVIVGGVEVGYSISMNSGDVITLYHGTNSNELTAPLIGVREHTDGKYYWTLDGEWLLDDSGNKVIAQGEPGTDGYEGEDGVTPELKIENDTWYVSYDGFTWTELGSAVSEGAASIFSEITYDDDNVYIVLEDGTELTVPRVQTLGITFGTSGTIELEPDSSVDITYTVESQAENVTVEVTSSIDLKAKVIPGEGLTGTIHVESGPVVDDYSRVTVIVSDETRTILKTLSFRAPAKEE